MKIKEEARLIATVNQHRTITYAALRGTFRFNAIRLRPRRVATSLRRTK